MIITHTADETRAAGCALARRLRPGDIVLLEGPLGSGKTTFVQGVAEELSAGTLATSPSFVFVHEYPISPANTSDHHSRRPAILRHIDLYRLPASPAAKPLQAGLPDPSLDLDRVGFEELLNDPTAVTLVEWGERLPPEVLYNRPCVLVRFAHGRSGETREIDIVAEKPA